MNIHRQMRQGQDLTGEMTDFSLAASKILYPAPEPNFIGWDICVPLWKVQPLVSLMGSTVQGCRKQALVRDRVVYSVQSTLCSHTCKSVIEWWVSLRLCLCYPRDDSVTYWYNDPLVTQAGAGPSYRSSSSAPPCIYMHLQMMLQDTCVLENKNFFFFLK